TRAAQNAVDLAEANLKAVQSAGNMESSFDNLSAKAKLLQAEIEALTRTDGDHAQKLAELRAALKQTEDAIAAMGKTTADTYHEMGLSTEEDINKMMAKDKERWETAIQLSADGNPAMVRQAKEAELQMLRDQDQFYGDLTTMQSKRMEELEQ